MEQISPLLVERILENAPRERDPRYFRAWQRVSLALQRSLREWIFERHFENSARFEDRDAAYPILVYAASRLCYGRPKTEFTYDIADPSMLTSAMHNIGVSLRLILQPIEDRLRAEDKRELSRRYSPIWRQDILRIVKKKPKTLLALLASEAALIDGVIDLGTSGDVRRFARTVNATLRNVLGQDMRDLTTPVLEETARVLEELKASRLDHLLGARIPQDDGSLGAGSPDGGIRCQEDRDHGNANCGGEMRDPGIVADVNPRASEPARELIKVIVSDSVLEGIFGSGEPFDRHPQPAGDHPEIFERPVLARAS